MPHKGVIKKADTLLVVETMPQMAGYSLDPRMARVTVGSKVVMVPNPKAKVTNPG